MSLARQLTIGVAVAVLVRAACALAGVPWEFALPLSVLGAWLFLIWVDAPPRNRQKSGET